MSFAQWVGFARVMVVRAKGMLAGDGQGAKLLPSRPLSATADPEAEEVTFLQDLMTSFGETTAEEPLGAVGAGGAKPRL